MNVIGRVVRQRGRQGRAPPKEEIDHLCACFADCGIVQGSVAAIVDMADDCIVVLQEHARYVDVALLHCAHEWCQAVHVAAVQRCTAFFDQVPGMIRCPVCVKILVSK